MWEYGHGLVFLVRMWIRWVIRSELNQVADRRRDIIPVLALMRLAVGVAPYVPTLAEGEHYDNTPVPMTRWSRRVITCIRFAPSFLYETWIHGCRDPRV